MALSITSLNWNVIANLPLPFLVASHNIIREATPEVGLPVWGSVNTSVT